MSTHRVYKSAGPLGIGLFFSLSFPLSFLLNVHFLSRFFLNAGLLGIVLLTLMAYCGALYYTGAFSALGSAVVSRGAKSPRNDSSSSSSGKEGSAARRLGAGKHGPAGAGPAGDPNSNLNSEPGDSNSNLNVVGALGDSGEVRVVKTRTGDQHMGEDHAGVGGLAGTPADRTLRFKVGLCAPVCVRVCPCVYVG